MQQPDPTFSRLGAIERALQSHALSSVFEAALMLVVGFLLFDSPAPRVDWQITDYAPAIVVWTFRYGGIAIGGVALLCFMGSRKGFMVDAVVNGVIGILFILSGLSLVADGNLIGALIVIFGAMSLNAARRSRNSHRQLLVIPQDRQARYVEEDDTPPEAAASVRTPEQAARAREAALNRLLKSKGLMAKDEPATTATVPPVPEPTPEIDLPDLDGPDDEEVQTPPDVPPLAEDEPAPDGFLADLGRDDDAGRHP